MTDKNKDFELEALWQSETGDIDMEMILDTRDRLEQSKRSDRLISNTLLAIIALATAIMGIFEFTGTLTTGGWITGGYFILLCLGCGGVLYERGKSSAVERLAPNALLKEAIRRAENTLLNARIMYSAFPLGMLGGVFIGRDLAQDKMDTRALDALPSGYMLAGLLIVLAAILAGSAWIIVYSVRLAERKKAELIELRARLASLEEDSL